MEISIMLPASVRRGTSSCSFNNNSGDSEGEFAGIEIWRQSQWLGVGDYALDTAVGIHQDTDSVAAASGLAHSRNIESSEDSNGFPVGVSNDNFDEMLLSNIYVEADIDYPAEILEDQPLYDETRDEYLKKLALARVPRSYKPEEPSVDSHTSRYVQALLGPSDAKQDARPKRKIRKGLPVSFEIDNGAKIIMTGYDTGTQGNHMSLTLAEEMGYTINTREDSKGKFELANGKIIESIGAVTAKVSFANIEPEEGNQSFICHFNVFKTLAVPALIGMAFLSATETLTRFTSRLVDLPENWKRSLRICAVGSAANRVSCVVDGRPVIAYADTGSEVALVNGAYAKRYGLLIEYGCEELMLADGSLEYTSGYAEVEFKLRRGPDQSYESWKAMKGTKFRFHVLKNLQFDVLLDEDMIDRFQIFQEGAYALVSRFSELTRSLSPIIHLGKAEGKAADSISAVGDKIKGWARAITNREKKEPIPTSTSTKLTDARNEILEKINDLDQEENRQREWVRKQNFVPGSLEAELEAEREQKYRSEREKLRLEYLRGAI